MEVSGAEAGEGEAITGEVVETVTDEVTGTVPIALEAWWLAAQRRFVSLSAGPQWPRQSGGELQDEKGAVWGGGDGEGKGKLGWPSQTLKPTST